MLLRAAYTFSYCWVYSAEAVLTESRLTPSPDSSRRVISRLISAQAAASRVRTVLSVSWPASSVPVRVWLLYSALE